LNKERGVTIVMVTHDPVNAEHCKRIIMVHDGLIEREQINPRPRQAMHIDEKRVY
jgi:ABC-type lipoprotein export system ATPase subunit